MNNLGIHHSSLPPHHRCCLLHQTRLPLRALPQSQRHIPGHFRMLFLSLLVVRDSTISPFELPSLCVWERLYVQSIAAFAGQWSTPAVHTVSAVASQPVFWPAITLSMSWSAALGRRRRFRRDWSRPNCFIQTTNGRMECRQRLGPMEIVWHGTSHVPTNSQPAMWIGQSLDRAKSPTGLSGRRLKSTQLGINSYRSPSRRWVQSVLRLRLSYKNSVAGS
jgi:hypothetical protein